MGSDPGKCVLCKSRKEDILNLGEMKKIDGVTAHYYCLLLSSTITQSGKDSDGILGFLASDILAEADRARKRICKYCKVSGATVICSAKCRVAFHLPCGLTNGSGHQFHGKFTSTCAEHRPRQKFTVPKDPQECPICYETIDFKDWMQVLRSPCCKNAFFHRPCVQQLALSAGYFFKCPMCNNKSTFLRLMRHYGVFVPDRDASWEMVPDAYGELLERHEECNAAECLYSGGRKESHEHGAWSLVLCNTCGSQGTHLQCSNLNRGDNWLCAICLAVKQHAKPETSGSEDEEATCTSRVTTSASGNVITVHTTTFDPQPSTSRGVISITNINITNNNVKINVVTKQIRKRKRAPHSSNGGTRTNTRARTFSNECNSDGEHSEPPTHLIDNSEGEDTEDNHVQNSDDENTPLQYLKERRLRKRTKILLETTKTQMEHFSDQKRTKGTRKRDRPRPDPNFTMNLRRHSQNNKQSQLNEETTAESTCNQKECYESNLEQQRSTGSEKNSTESEAIQRESPELGIDQDKSSESYYNRKLIIESDEDDVIFVKQSRCGTYFLENQEATEVSDDEIIVID